MTINVLINGAFGRMGQSSVKAISEHNGLNLVAQLGREDDLKKSIQASGATVVLDFTDAESVFANSKTILEAGAHPVIGTSGLTTAQIATLQKLALELGIGGMIVPNFSLGAVLMMKYAAEIVKYMPNVEIVEMHHDKKLDSPSGTALRTASMLASANKNVNKNLPASKEIVPHARGALDHGIPIHAMRLPGLVAHQSVIFGGTGETLTIRHDSIDRLSFMPGVCLACEKAVTLNELVCGLESVL